MSRRRIVVYTVRRYDRRYNDEYHYEDQQLFLKSLLPAVRFWHMGCALLPPQRQPSPWAGASGRQGGTG
jgi:hypothetical protein